MKISYQPAGGGAYTTLLDDGNLPQFDSPAFPSSNDSFKGKFAALVQEDNMFQQTAALRQPLGNIKGALTWKLTATYASFDKALASIRTFVGLVNLLVNLKVEQGTEVQYYHNALISSGGYDFELHGGSVDHTISFTSDAVNNTA